MNTDPLELPASVARLHEWRQRGEITDSVMDAMLRKLRLVEIWRGWASMCFLILGVVLLLCGIVFFFAWNWEGMERWQQLALSGVGVLLPAFGSRFVSEGTLGKKMCLLTASTMVGVFIAVFGQEYQTGEIPMACSLAGLRCRCFGFYARSLKHCGFSGR
jgi:uncharacterized membrane protein